MKDIIIKRAEIVQMELKSLTEDHTKLTNVLREIEQKIILANGKLQELQALMDMVVQMEEMQKDAKQIINEEKDKILEETKENAEVTFEEENDEEVLEIAPPLAEPNHEDEFEIQPITVDKGKTKSKKK